MSPFPSITGTIMRIVVGGAGADRLEELTGDSL